MNNLVARDNPEFEVSSIIKPFVGIMGLALIADFVLRITGTTNTAIAQYIRAQSYVGVSDPRTVEATDELTLIDLVGSHPYTPWVSVNFVNDGPDSVKIAINYPTAVYELKADESASVYRIGAQERISVIFLSCDDGESASVRIIGEY